MQPTSRAAYARLVKQGWTDCLRKIHADAPIYPFWHYSRNRWQRDAGLRIDHVLPSPDLAHRLIEAGVDKASFGKAQ